MNVAWWFIQIPEPFGKLSNLDFICNNADAATNLNFSAELNIGSYTITRKLLVNKQAAESYANAIINDPNNSCLKPYKAFYNEAWRNRDTTRCMNPCDACNAESKSQSGEQLELALKACDSLWCHPQIATMCDIARMSMINDLTPGGQYAEYRDASGNINLLVNGISIFNDVFSLIGIKKLMNATSPIPTIQISLPGEPTQALSYYYAAGHPEKIDTTNC